MPPVEGKSYEKPFGKVTALSELMSLSRGLFYGSYGVGLYIASISIKDLGLFLSLIFFPVLFVLLVLIGLFLAC